MEEPFSWNQLYYSIFSTVSYYKKLPWMSYPSILVQNGVVESVRFTRRFLEYDILESKWRSYKSTVYQKIPRTWYMYILESKWRSYKSTVYQKILEHNLLEFKWRSYKSTVYQKILEHNILEFKWRSYKSTVYQKILEHNILEFKWRSYEVRFTRRYWNIIY